LEDGNGNGNGNGSGRGRRGNRYAKVKCWNCGVMGHIARDCKHGQDSEEDDQTANGAREQAVAHAAEAFDNLACC
jgi:ribosomal protein L15